MVACLSPEGETIKAHTLLPLSLSSSIIIIKHIFLHFFHLVMWGQWASGGGGWPGAALENFGIWLTFGLGLVFLPFLLGYSRKVTKQQEASRSRQHGNGSNTCERSLPLGLCLQWPHTHFPWHCNTSLLTDTAAGDIPVAGGRQGEEAGGGRNGTCGHGHACLLSSLLFYFMHTSNKHNRERGKSLHSGGRQAAGRQAGRQQPGRKSKPSALCLPHNNSFFEKHFCLEPGLYNKHTYRKMLLDGKWRGILREERRKRNSPALLPLWPQPGSANMAGVRERRGSNRRKRKQRKASSISCQLRIINNKNENSHSGL